MIHDSINKIYGFYLKYLKYGLFTLPFDYQFRSTFKKASVSASLLFVTTIGGAFVRRSEDTVASGGGDAVARKYALRYPDRLGDNYMYMLR
jgi:hypothetical protein